jgi:hypothetical protein
MRVFAVAADIAMGVILGLFLFAVVARLWPALSHPAYGVLIALASVLIVLFRRPNGSLAARRDKA